MDHQEVFAKGINFVTEVKEDIEAVTNQEVNWFQDRERYELSTGTIFEGTKEESTCIEGISLILDSQTIPDDWEKRPDDNLRIPWIKDRMNQWEELGSMAF